MTKQKPMNPYSRLLAVAREFASAVEFRHKRFTMALNRADVARNAPFCMNDLLQRVIAADQLGYATEIRLTDEQMQFWLVKKVPDRPVELL